MPDPMTDPLAVELLDRAGDHEVSPSVFADYLDENGWPACAAAIRAVLLPGFDRIMKSNRVGFDRIMKSNRVEPLLRNSYLVSCDPHSYINLRMWADEWGIWLVDIGVGTADAVREEMR